MITNDEEQEGFRDSSRGAVSGNANRIDRQYLPAVFDKQLKIDFKHGLEQAHIGTLVQSDLVFPDVDNQDFAGRKRKERAFALKVLVLAALTSVCALDIHDQDVLGHARAAFLALVLAHPDALCGLPALLLGHDAKLGAKEVVEQRGLARRLRAKDGNDVVVEAGRNDLLDVEVGSDVLATMPGTLAMHTNGQLPTAGRDALEDLVLINDLDAMLVGLTRGVFADAREMRVHHKGWCRGVLDVAGTEPIDLELSVCHGCASAGREQHVCGKNTGVGVKGGRRDVTGRRMLRRPTSFAAACSLSRAGWWLPAR